MIGLPYDEFNALLPTHNVDDLIDLDKLDIGSIYYDSNRDENIVGKWLAHPNQCRELTLETEDEFLKICDKFKEQFPDITFKLYLTNCVW